MPQNKGTAIFVMPRSSKSWKGAEALWITVGGWADAAQKKLGNAIVLTTDRLAKADEVINYPIEGNSDDIIHSKKTVLRFLPIYLKTFLKDLKLWYVYGRKKNLNFELPINKEDVSFIWEQHDFFPGIGYSLSKKYQVPFIKYVHAPQVWESKKWGVKRPVWGRFMEKIESNSLRKADIVACVSPQVVEKLVNLGIEKDKILVSPMAVNPSLFEGIDSSSIYKKYDLKDKFVIGWIGSFRSFHGLDILLETFKEVVREIPNACLLLVGDGSEKKKISELAKKLSIEKSVVFTGRKKFEEIPLYVNTFDLAVVSASKVSDFHYSPLKLREYLGAGKATLAPNAGEIPQVFKDNLHLKLYNVGEVKDTANLIIDLAKSEETRKSIGLNGKKFIQENATWEVELNKVMNKLEMSLSEIN